MMTVERRSGMDDVLRDQILAVRDTGLVNMFDIKRVRQVAEEFEFNELLAYLDEDTAGYVVFILHGE